MKSLILYIILFFLSTSLYSKNYCIYIDTYNLNRTNKSKIHSIISDLPYPSFKVHNNTIFLYSGKFNSYEAAKRLLYVTRTKYPKAKIATCEDATIYTKETPLLQNRKQKTKEPVKKQYCLKIYETKNIQSSATKKKVKQILQKLPQSYIRKNNHKLVVYSGHFDNRETVKAILNIVRKEFGNAKIVSCTIEKSLKKQKSPQTEAFDQKPIQQKNRHLSATIYNLDDKGLISKELLSNNTKKSTLQQIKKSDIRHAFDIEQDEKFNGLYFKVNSAWDTLNNSAAYDIRLEFDLFDQGYYQTLKKNQKNNIDNKISFLKTLKNIEVLKKEQEFLKIRKYTNAINVSALLLKLKLLETNLDQAKKMLQNGLITSYTYDTYLLSIQKLKDELLLFRNMSLLKIPKDLWVLLNQIEHVRLVSEKELIAMLEENSIDLQLSKTLQQKKPLEDTWSDKLRVNIYVGQRKMYLSQTQNLIGIDAKIPLSNYTRTKELQIIQDTIASNQAILQHAQTKELLKESIAIFKYKQRKLKTYSYELAKIKEHVTNLHIVNNSAYALYAKSNFNNEQQSINNYFDKYIQIQKERIETYRELINIMYLIHTTDIRKILRYAIEK